MAFTWEQLLAACNGAYEDVDGHWVQLQGILETIYGHMQAEHWELATTWLYYFAIYTRWTLEDLMIKGWYDNYWYLIPEMFYRVGEAEPPELTMEAIINAMLTASSDEVMYFVGLVDAYRQSVWNKPFNEEFFAALARGFE